MDNRSHDDTDWDLDLLGPELEELHGLDFDLSLTGFEQHEIDKFLADPEAEDRANAAPPLPETPVTKPGDLWLCAKHRILCGDATSAHTVARLLAGTEPLLLVTDPPYGVSLDGTWRDKAGINKHGPAEPSYMMHRTEGHTHTTISGDTIADWSHAFELVPSLQAGYVWHASRFTRRSWPVCCESASSITSSLFGGRLKQRSPERTIGISTSHVCMFERKMLHGSASREKTRRCGTPPRPR